jgi:hypothetical protein
MNLESIAHTIADIALGSPITVPGGPLPEGVDLAHPAWEPLIRSTLELAERSQAVQAWAINAADVLTGAEELERVWAIADDRRAQLDQEFQEALSDCAAAMRDAA